MRFRRGSRRWNCSLIVSQGPKRGSKMVRSGSYLKANDQLDYVKRQPRGSRFQVAKRIIFATWNLWHQGEQHGGQRCQKEAKGVRRLWGDHVGTLPEGVMEILSCTRDHVVRTYLLNSAARLFEKVASGLRISSCKTNRFCNLKFVASGWATSRPEVSKENQRWYKWIKGAPSERKNRARGTEISSCRAKPFCNLKLVSSRQAKWRSVASEETQRTHKWATSEPKVPKDSKIVNSHWARANCQH